jgi:hypothetical protein
VLVAGTTSDWDFIEGGNNIAKHNDSDCFPRQVPFIQRKCFNGITCTDVKNKEWTRMFNLQLYMPSRFGEDGYGHINNVTFIGQNALI